MHRIYVNISVLYIYICTSDVHIDHSGSSGGGGGVAVLAVVAVVAPAAGGK